jgi:hypothetical protein
MGAPAAGQMQIALMRAAPRLTLVAMVDCRLS